MKPVALFLVLVMTMTVLSGCLIQIDLELRHPPTQRYYSYIENRSGDTLRVVISSLSRRESDRVFPKIKPGERIYPELPDGRYEMVAVGYYDNRYYGSISFYASRYERWRILIFGPRRIRLEK